MLISIITINYNNLKGLQKTMQSVLEQTYSMIEYIIIDGNSNDGSANYIKDNSSKLSFWTSEKDNGIYDAMNKGVAKATGNYVLFLNSGDVLSSHTVIQDFVDLKPVEDIVYGNSKFVFKDKEPILKVMPDDLLGTTIFNRTLNHQATFVKCYLFKNQKFDLKYKILADWAFYNTVVIVNKGTFRHLDLLVSHYDGGGLSSSNKAQQDMKNDRALFFKEHATIFINLLLKENQKKEDYIKHLKQAFVFKKVQPMINKIKKAIKF